MKTKIINEVRKALKEAVDQQALESSARFFKKGEEALVYGVKITNVGKIGKEFYNQIKGYSKQEIFELCEELWKSKYLEEAIIACRWAENLSKQYEPSDFKIFERWIKNYVNNWADCDSLCCYVIGKFIIMYPNYIAELKKWAKSKNRWAKRAAAVTLVVPSRKGLFLDDIFEIADILLLDKDDLVQKGYGWMLKVASQSYQKEVFDYIISKKSIMPRTALRYAIEKMPKELKIEAMKK